MLFSSCSVPASLCPDPQATQRLAQTAFAEGVNNQRSGWFCFSCVSPYLVETEDLAFVAATLQGTFLPQDRQLADAHLCAKTPLAARTLVLHLLHHKEAQNVASNAALVGHVPRPHFWQVFLALEALTRVQLTYRSADSKQSHCTTVLLLASLRHQPH